MFTELGFCSTLFEEAVTLVHTDFVRFSQSCDDVMACRWWEIQILQSFTLKNIFMKLFDYF